MSFLGSAAGSIGGAIVGGIVGHYSAKQNAALQRQNWAYMQSNAHQLEVEDLKKAGLNPILSATNSQMAGMSSVSGSDYGAGQAFSSAIQAEASRRLEKENKLLDVNIKEKELDNEAKRIEIEDYIARRQADLWQVQGNYYNAQVANDTKRTNAEVAKINQDIANSIHLTSAQVENLRSGSALNYRLADKVVSEIENILSDTEYKNVNIQELRNVLTDPKRKIERQAWLEALEGNNMLGSLHRLGLIGDEVGRLFPSRIGIGLSRR